VDEHGRVEVEPVVSPPAPPAGEPLLPRPVIGRLEPGERPLVVIAGAQSSGLALTDRRIVRWRPPGALVFLAIDEIETIDIRRATAEHPALLAFSGGGGSAALAIALDARHVAAAMEAVQVIVGTVHAAHRARLRRPVGVDRSQSPARTTWQFDTRSTQRRRLFDPRAARED
jgi:hypothetical protein